MRSCLSRRLSACVAAMGVLFLPDLAGASALGDVFQQMFNQALPEVMGREIPLPIPPITIAPTPLTVSNIRVTPNTDRVTVKADAALADVPKICTVTVVITGSGITLDCPADLGIPGFPSVHLQGAIDWNAKTYKLSGATDLSVLGVRLGGATISVASQGLSARFEVVGVVVSAGPVKPREIWQAIQDAAKKLLNPVGAAVTAAGQAVAAAGSAAAQAGAAAASWVAQGFKSVGKFLSGAAQAVWNGIKNVAGTALKALGLGEDCPRQSEDKLWAGAAKLVAERGTGAPGYANGLKCYNTVLRDFSQELINQHKNETDRLRREEGQKRDALRQEEQRQEAVNFLQANGIRETEAKRPDLFRLLPPALRDLLNEALNEAIGRKTEAMVAETKELVERERAQKEERGLAKMDAKSRAVHVKLKETGCRRLNDWHAYTCDTPTGLTFCKHFVDTHNLAAKYNVLWCYWKTSNSPYAYDEKKAEASKRTFLEFRAGRRKPSLGKDRMGLFTGGNKNKCKTNPGFKKQCMDAYSACVQAVMQGTGKPGDCKRQMASCCNAQ
jgi:hypothetical protein